MTEVPPVLGMAVEQLRIQGRPVDNTLLPGSPSAALLPGHHSSSSTESTDRVRLRWVVITAEGRLTAFQLFAPQSFSLA